MVVAVHSLINNHQLPTGRRLFALKLVRALAAEFGLPRIVQHVDMAIEHDCRTQSMEMRQSARPTAFYGPEAQGLDNLLDQGLMGLDTYLESQVRLYGADSERGGAAGRIRQAIFPDGPWHIIKLPYVQENQAVYGILARLGEPDLAGDVARLPELPRALAHIRQLNDRYGAALARVEVTSAPTMDEVQKARTRGQDYLAETVALIIAEFAGREEEPYRDALLEPILVQNEAVRQARRRRRTPVDIDPATGHEMPDHDTAEAPGQRGAGLDAPGLPFP